jgi:4-hydroxybutyryl-CoA dehydratase/vinylacetyl-CoA-Delta-isomerase
MQNKMQRALGQRTGTCFQRCVGMDAINSCFSITYDIDQAHQTPYHERFKSFLVEMQAQNCVLGGAMTDPKGDRSKGPAEQDDEDLFVHIAERRVDGVVLRGAKMHQTGTINAHWMIVMPGGRMTEADRDYSVICAVPVTAPGLTFIVGRQSCDTRSMEDTATDIDHGNAKFGGQEATIVYDDVFVPNKYIFMNGEVEFAAELVERFTAYHRRSYICKAGLGDVLIGAAATISDYNGTAKASHVRDKLVEMAYLNENIAGTALAASYQSFETAAGNYQPDVLMANVCKHNVTKFPYEIARIAQDLAGGLMVTLASDQDFEHEVTGPLLYKYLKTTASTTVDNRRRILRLIENLTVRACTAVKRPERCPRLIYTALCMGARGA